MYDALKTGNRGRTTDNDFYEIVSRTADDDLVVKLWYEPFNEYEFDYSEAHDALAIFSGFTGYEMFTDIENRLIVVENDGDVEGETVYVIKDGDGDICMFVQQKFLHDHIVNFGCISHAKVTLKLTPGTPDFIEQDEAADKPDDTAGAEWPGRVVYDTDCVYDLSKLQGSMAVGSYNGCCGFYWSETPQGHYWWISRKGFLTDETSAAMEDLLAQYWFETGHRPLGSKVQEFTIKRACGVLDGDHEDLLGAFTWNTTTQDHSYWSDRGNGRVELTALDRAMIKTHILHDMRGSASKTIKVAA